MEYLRVGFLWGVVFSTIHAGWAWIVAQNYGQPLVDFLLKIHFLSNPFIVQIFDAEMAFFLIALSGILGLIGGIAFSLLRDLLQTSTPYSDGSNHD